MGPIRRSEAEVEPRNPMRGTFPAGCASAASGAARRARERRATTNRFIGTSRCRDATAGGRAAVNGRVGAVERLRPGGQPNRHCR